MQMVADKDKDKDKDHVCDLGAREETLCWSLVREERYLVSASRIYPRFG